MEIGGGFLKGLEGHLHVKSREKAEEVIHFLNDHIISNYLIMRKY